MPISRRHFLCGSLALPAFAAKKGRRGATQHLLLVADDLPSWMVARTATRK